MIRRNGVWKTLSTVHDRTKLLLQRLRSFSYPLFKNLQWLNEHEGKLNDLSERVKKIEMAGGMRNLDPRQVTNAINEKASCMNAIYVSGASS